MSLDAMAHLGGQRAGHPSTLRAWLLSVLAPLCWVACGGLDEPADASGCDSAECVQSGITGRCEEVGYCSYADPDCRSGRSWGLDAPTDRAGRCVAAEPADSCGCEDDGNECTIEVCVLGVCAHPPDYDGNGCLGGVCRGGQCCQGCWDGDRCRAGSDLAACGSYGQLCRECPTDSCLEFGCAGACYAEPVNGPGCPPCGGADQPCCAGSACDAGLLCTGVECGEDCIEKLCQ